MKKKFKRREFLIVISILFILVIPAILIVVSATWLGRTWIGPEVVEEEVPEHIIPTQILADKMKYKDQFLVVRGQVVGEDVVCERKICPQDDPCCGCKSERDLIIVDSGASLSQSQGRLRLLSSEGKSFCQRKDKSCEYACPDWQVGGIYEVRGTFRAEPPPRGSGLKIYFGYHLEVQEKDLVRTLGFFERARALINDLRNFVASSRTSGYYILH